MTGSSSVSRWIIPVLILPGTVLVLVPLLILRMTQGTEFAAGPVGPESLSFWLAVLIGVPGAALSMWSMSVFFRFGEGTAAPWDVGRILPGQLESFRNDAMASRGPAIR